MFKSSLGYVGINEVSLLSHGQGDHEVFRFVHLSKIPQRQTKWLTQEKSLFHIFTISLKETT